MSISFKETADALRKYAAADLANNMVNLDDPGHEDETTEMYEGDNKDILAIAGLIELGETAAANHAIFEMDTDPREGVGYSLAEDSPEYFVKYLEPAGWCALKDMD